MIAETFDLGVACTTRSATRGCRKRTCAGGRVCGPCQMCGCEPQVRVKQAAGVKSILGNKRHNHGQGHCAPFEVKNSRPSRRRSSLRAAPRRRLPAERSVAAPLAASMIASSTVSTPAPAPLELISVILRAKKVAARKRSCVLRYRRRGEVRSL